MQHEYHRNDYLDCLCRRVLGDWYHPEWIFMSHMYECDCGARYSSYAGLEACQINNHGLPLEYNWEQFIGIMRKWLEKYPPDIFDGSSGDPGPVLTSALHKALRDYDAAQK
jgi:hypothetical protein